MPNDLDIEDPAALIGYLRQTRRIEPEETPTVLRLAGGVSNRAMLVRRSSGESWVLKQALHKLRVKVDWFSDPVRIQREAAGMRALEQLAPCGTIPKLIFVDPPVHLLAMSAIPEPHENWKTLLLGGRVQADHVRQFAQLLGTIHRTAAEHAQALARDFADRSFFESLRVEPYYLYAAEQCPPAAPFLRGLVEETRATRYTLVHGDYSPKNILVHKGTLILLDHEVIHWGDGAFDLGFSLTHFLSKAHFLVPSRRLFLQAARQYWNAYVQCIGSPLWAEVLEPRAVRHTLGCLMARCVGRSPLEYLSDEQRLRQAQVALGLMSDPPRRIHEMIDEFGRNIECRQSKS